MRPWEPPVCESRCSSRRSHPGAGGAPMMSTFIVFAFLAAIIIVPQYLRYRDRARLHETLRVAFERGQPVPPELVEALQFRRRGGAAPIDALQPYPVAGRPERDLRRGVIWLAIGLGLVGVGGAFYAGLYN